MSRTAEAVFYFFDYAKNKGAAKIYAFATEAVRNAENRFEFIDLLKKQNIDLDVISAEKESQIGFLGAYNGGIMAVLDVGGASSELAVGNGEKIFYSHSLPLGCVRLKDLSKNAEDLKNYISERVAEYGEVPYFDSLTVIGGTVSSLVAVKLGMETYDSETVHGYLFDKKSLNDTVQKISSVPPEKRKDIKGMHPDKILTLPCGGLLILGIMDYLNVDYIRVSEKDNIEGYMIYNNLI